MYRSTAIIFITSFAIFGCGGSADPTAPEDAKKEGDTPASSNKTEVTLASRGSSLERISTNAAAFIRKEELTKARQEISAGLNLISRDETDLETHKARLLLQLGTVEREEGREVEARRHYADAMAIFHVQKDTTGRFETYLAQGQLEAQLGDYPAAARQYDAAEALLEAVSSPTLNGMYHLHRGRLASRKVDRDTAKSRFLNAVKLFEETGEKRLVAETMLMLAAEEDAVGRTSASRHYLDRALGIFNDIEELQGQAHATHRLAALAEREKKYKKARQLLKKVLKLYEALDQNTAATKVERHLSALPDPE
ncbi:MAG: tetratricopeptide repeat protein [Myxococcota bacterium]|nr:tetratricopeptide repeat protein [Myxococcota bacterium]